jgi:ABC-2 type transport system permease protein
MTGLYTVFRKELADHFTSWRFIILFLLVLTVGLVAIYVAAGNILVAVSGSSGDYFLALFTTSIVETSSNIIPSSFLQLIALLIPVVGIALGLDAINNERNNGTLSRLISQPIYRDNVINGKFLAGVVTLSVVILTCVLLVTGLGIRMIGIVPSSEEVWRLFFFVIIAVIYGSFWLGLSILFSILFRRVATSALAAIAIWIFFAFFFPMIQQLVANSMQYDTAEEQISSLQKLITISRLSPIRLFNESMTLVLVAGSRSMSQMLTLMSTDAINYMVSTPISLAQSLLSVWPHIVVTILLTIICFAISYVKFMREEIRPT